MKYLVLGLCLVLGWAEHASAAFITRSGVFLEEFGNPYHHQDLHRLAIDNWREGGTSSSAAASLPLSSASASVDLFNDPGIRLTSFAASGADGLGAQISSSSASAGAGWQDVIRISGAAAPDLLRLVFSVEGSFEIGIGPIGTGNMRFGMVMFPDSNITFSFNNDSRIPEAWSAFNFGQMDQFAAGASWFPSPNSYISPPSRSDNFQIGPSGSVSWDFSIKLPYSSQLGGYDMNFYASLNATSNSGGYTNADFGSTIRLTALTNIDGSPLDGTASFDSGFQLTNAPGPTPSPVPEPATLWMFAIGGAGAVLGRLRARIQRRSA